MMLEGLISGLSGGLLRFAPEVLKFFDRKNERSHELALVDKTYQLDKLHADAGLALAQAQAAQATDTGELDLMRAAIEAQARPSGIAWIDAINSLIRPILTLYWCVALYSWAIWARFVTLKAQGLATSEAVLALWGPAEQSIVFVMIGFWFADRAIKAGHSVLK